MIENPLRSQEDRVNTAASKRHRSPALAAALSLIPGLGQLYTRQPIKAAAFFLAFLVSLPLVYYVVGMVTIPVLWVWSGWDAYNRSRS